MTSSRGDQCCGSGFIESGPTFQVNPDPIPNPDPGFWWLKIEEKNTAENFYIYFFDQKLQFTYS